MKGVTRLKNKLILNSRSTPKRVTCERSQLAINIRSHGLKIACGLKTYAKAGNVFTRSIVRSLFLVQVGSVTSPAPSPNLDKIDQILGWLNSRILPLLGPSLILPWVKMDPSIILHYYLVRTQILQL